MRQRRHLVGRNIDAVLLERKSVLFRWLAEIRARFGQDGGTNPRIVVHQLRFQLGEWLLPSSELVLLAERSNALEIMRVARQLGLYLDARRVHNARLGPLLDDTLLENLSNRLVSRIKACVSLQSHDSCWPPG